MQYPSIFINTTGCDNWILKIIADDIVNELTRLGYHVRKGRYEEYDNEEVAYHMWWRVALPYKNARVNSVFITHIDDSMKEFDLCSMKNRFNSFVTMSNEDANFLIDLGFNKSKVFGLDLPARNTFIRPISLGIFSNCYPDNRKNENWLLEYCEQFEVAKCANFVFIGFGWASFIDKLSKSSCSFEWHCVSRSMPYEYFFQQLKLEKLDCYIYMGMDGGAMGSYDAYAMGIPLCISNDGYHKGIPDIDYTFETKEEFFGVMNNILNKHKHRLDFYAKNNVLHYVNSLLSIWTIGETIESNKTQRIDSSSFQSVVEKRRSNYFPWNIARIRQSLAAWLRKKRTKQK